MEEYFLARELIEIFCQKRNKTRKDIYEYAYKHLIIADYKHIL